MRLFILIKHLTYSRRCMPYLFISLFPGYAQLKFCYTLVRSLCSFLSVLSIKLTPPPPSFIFDHPQYVIRFLILHHPLPAYDHPGLPSAGILLGQFSWNLPLPQMCPLSNVHSTDPTLFLGYKFPLVHVLFRVEPNVSVKLQHSIQVVTIPITQ